MTVGLSAASTFYPQVQGVGTGFTPNRSGSAGGGGEMGQYDPWSKYRGKYGDELDKLAENDPAVAIRERMTRMLSGEFSPDDPSYQWRYDQGQQAVERSLASRGLLNSGNAAIELQQYGQGAASTEYGAQFNRMLAAMTGVEQQYDTQMQRLMKMAGVIDPTEAGRLDVANKQIKLGYDQNDIARLGESRLMQGMQWDQNFATNQDLGIGAGLGGIGRGTPSNSGGIDLSAFASLFSNMSQQSSVPAPSATPSYTPSFSSYTPGQTGPNYNGYEAMPESTFNYSVGV